MAITVDEAAEVATQAGLGLPDVRALVVLSDDVAHARRLAQRFAAADMPTVGGRAA